MCVWENGKRYLYKLKQTNTPRQTHRQNVLHGDDKDVVGNQEVPEVQDLFDGLQQQFPTKEQEIETGHQVAHAEDADTCGARDEDDGEDEPEQVAKHNDLQHVEVGPGKNTTTISEGGGVDNPPLSGVIAAKTSTLAAQDLRGAQSRIGKDTSKFMTPEAYGLNRTLSELCGKPL